MDAATRSTRLRALVVDTAALIENVRLDAFADELVTVPEVLAEVRNEVARRQMLVQPQEIKTRQPSSEAVAAVTEFAKKTGDFASLSAVDLRVLALTYMLEVEYSNGETAHLNKEPKTQTVVHETHANALPRADLPGFYLPPSAAGAPDEEEAEDEEGMEFAEHDHEHPQQQEGEQQPEDDGGGWETVPQRRRKGQKAKESANDDDDENGWITPSNFEAAKEMHHVMARIGGAPTPESVVPVSKVGCITADFAMQNVLLQIGLHIQDIRGRVIKYAKTFVLRCHACFKSTKDMTKKFCPSCGNNTLIRTSVSIGSDGVLQYHLKSTFQYNLRGSKYAIPDTKGGRKAKNIVLREDQKEYQQALGRAKKAWKQDLADPDYVSPLVSGSTRPNSAQGGPVGVRVGFGRKNPNEARHYTGKKSKFKQQD